MKKWLITTLLVIACVFGLVACGGSSNNSAPSEVELTEEQKQQWYDSASQFVLSMNEAIATGQAEAQMDDPVYGPAFSSWQKSAGYRRKIMLLYQERRNGNRQGQGFQA